MLHQTVAPPLAFDHTLPLTNFKSLDRKASKASMGCPRLNRIRNVLATIMVLGALILTMAGTAAARGSWPKSVANYDNHRQWHDADWWLQNRP